MWLVITKVRKSCDIILPVLGNFHCDLHNRVHHADRGTGVHHAPLLIPPQLMEHSRLHHCHDWVSLYHHAPLLIPSQLMEHSRLHHSHDWVSLYHHAPLLIPTQLIEHSRLHHFYDWVFLVHHDFYRKLFKTHDWVDDSSVSWKLKLPEQFQRVSALIGWDDFKISWTIPKSICFDRVGWF